ASRHRRAAREHGPDRELSSGGPGTPARLRTDLEEGSVNETVLKIAFPGVLFVFAVSIVVQALQMSGPLVETNAHVYPLVVAVVLALGALASMIGAVRGTDGTGEAAPDASAAGAGAGSATGA